jgi:predicted GNAT family acetyltransferase
MTVRWHADHGAVDWQALTRDLVADRFDNGRTPRQLELSFRQSYAAAYACDGPRVIGTARVLSDGVCNAYLVDLWTQSGYRRRGIARRTIEMLCERLAGQHLCLFTDDAPAFYTACGFAQRGIAFERMVCNWLDNETRC